MAVAAPERSYASKGPEPKRKPEHEARDAPPFEAHERERRGRGERAPALSFLDAAEDAEAPSDEQDRGEPLAARQSGLGNGLLAARAASEETASEEAEDQRAREAPPDTPIARRAAMARARQVREEARRSDEPEYAQSVAIERPEDQPAPIVEESAEGEEEASALAGEAAEDEKAAQTETEEAEAQLEEEAAQGEEGAEETAAEGEDVLGELEKEEGASEEGSKEKSEEAAAAGGAAAAAVAPGVVASQAAATTLSTAAGALTEAVTRPVAFAPHPEEASPDRGVASRGAAKRRASEAIAGAFIARNAHHTEALLSLAYTAPPRIFAAAEAAKAAVDAAVAQNVATVTAAIASATATVQQEAAAAKAVIEAQRALTLVTIATTSAAARLKVLLLYTQADAELTALEAAQKVGIAAAYRTWHPLLEAVGGEIGGEGMTIARRRADAWLAQRNGESSLLDGPIHDNRLEARADAAIQVAESYQKEFEKAAGEQATQVVAGEADTLQYVTDSAQQAREGLTQHRDAIFDALATSEQQATEQTNQLADQMVESVDTSLATTVASLAQQQAAEMARLAEYSITQKIALDDQAGQAVAALLEGGAQAVDGFTQSMREFLDTAVGMSAPESEELSGALAEVQGQVDALAAALLGQMEQGIAASEQGVITGGLQAVDAINQLGQSAEAQAAAAAQAFVESTSAMLQQAMRGFADLRKGQNETADQVKASAEEGFGQAVDALRESFSTLSTNTVDNFTAAREEMRANFRQSLPKLEQDITDQAQAAADAVQPRWKSVLKWVITIVVIVAVVALTIVSAGSLGVVGTIVLGAALGAAAGAATQIGHNLVDGKEWSDGVGKAMVVGAIGGAFGGIGGAIAGKVASVGLKFAIETGVDVVGGIVGDLAVGNPLTIEGILFGAAIGAGVGAGVGIAGALKGKIKIRPTPSPTVSAPKPSVSAAAGAPSPAPRPRPTADAGAAAPPAAKAPPEAPAARPAPKPAPEPPAPKPVAAPPAAKAAPEAPAGKAAPEAAPATPAPKPAPEAPPAPKPAEAAAPKPAPEAPAAKGAPESAAPSKPGEAPTTTTKVVTDEPNVAARRKTSDGHEITVTKDGHILRCTKCDLNPYKDVLDADATLAKRAEDVKARLASDDPEVQAAAAKEWDELSDELERRLKASADPSAAPAKASPDDAGPPKPAEEGDAAPPTAPSKESGADLAKKLGYPDAEPGYHWANVDGKPVYKRNRGNPGPRKVYDPATGTFKSVGGVDITKRPYSDSGKVEPCFVAGTIVKTPNGDRPIEELRSGDPVFSYDTTEGRVTVQHVVRVYRNTTHHVTRVAAADCTLHSTRLHHFWVDDLNAWLPACDLEPGMRLRTLNGTLVSCDEPLVTERTEPTFNLETSVCRNYFVGSTGLLVHNVSGFELKDPMLTRIYEIVDTRTGQVVYVGKTFQGDAGDVFKRFRQHITKKDDWRKMRQFLEPRLAKQGNWTVFETAVWEQHFMDKHGGPRSANPNTPLFNKNRAIVESKYNKYRDPKYGHNPCP